MTYSVVFCSHVYLMRNDVPISLRLSQDLYLAIKRLAKQEDRHATEWMRLQLRAAVAAKKTQQQCSNEREGGATGTERRKGR